MNNMHASDNERSNTGQSISDEELDQIRASLKGLRFGSVNITVQDGVVVQIDRTEKRRLRKSSPNSQ